MTSTRSSTPSCSGPGKIRQKWTPEDDRILIDAVAQAAAQETPINWHKIAPCLPGRTNKNCRKRWHYKLAQDFRKGLWTAEEDERLRAAVQKHGVKWRMVSEDVKTRNGDQCWKRWNDCLKPDIDHSPWSAQEDIVLLQQVEKLGTAWSEIVSQHLPGRTALAAKNRYVVLERRGDSSLGPHVPAIEDIQFESSFDRTTMTNIGSDTPLLGLATAITDDMAPLNGCSVTDIYSYKWDWCDANLSVSNFGVIHNNAHWTPDPFSHILCRNYMTPYIPPAELSNEALALSTVDSSNVSVTPGSGDNLEMPGLDMSLDNLCYMNGSPLGLQETIPFLNRPGQPIEQLDIDIGGFFADTDNITVPQGDNSEAPAHSFSFNDRF